MQDIKIDLIRIDGGTQARVELNEATVAEYAEAITEGATLPPIVVFFDGSDHWMGDGFHRYFANKKIGAVTMAADVRPGSKRDAILFACGANDTHGMRRSNADKRKAVTLLLLDAEWGKWSDREIARRVGVGHPLVAAVRASLEEIPVSGERKVVTKHGTETVMDTGKIGKGKKDAPITGGATAGAGAKGKAKAATPPPAPAAPRELTEAEKNAEEAYGDTTLEKELAESRLEVEALQKVVAAAEADDLKAEAMKWRRISEVATRRQSELMDAVHRREQELQRQAKTIARICRAVGEEDPTKVAATVEMFVRNSKVVA